MSAHRAPTSASGPAPTWRSCTWPTRRPRPSPRGSSAGFQRVNLGPGKSTQVQFTVTPRDTWWWDETANGWSQSTGHYGLFVGDSSALSDLPLHSGFNLSASPAARQVQIQSPSTMQAGKPSIVTVTLTRSGNATLHGVTLALQLPQGWKAARSAARRSATWRRRRRRPPRSRSRRRSTRRPPTPPCTPRRRSGPTPCARPASAWACRKPPPQGIGLPPRRRLARRQPAGCRPPLGDRPLSCYTPPRSMRNAAAIIATSSTPSRRTRHT